MLPVLGKPGRALGSGWRAGAVWQAEWRALCRHAPSLPLLTQPISHPSPDPRSKVTVTRDIKLPLSGWLGQTYTPS